MTMRKGKVFLSRMQKQTEQDNPCLWFPLFLLRFPQEPGRYTSDRTNLGTSAAPNNCQYNPVKLKFTILLFWNSRFMKIIRHQIPVIQDPSLVKVAFKTVKRSIVWPTAVRKLKVFNISEQPSILCLCFFDSPVEIKYRIFCKFCVLEFSVYSVFYNIPCIPLFHRMGSPKYRGGHGIKKIGDQQDF